MKIPLAIETISVLHTKENIISKSINSLQWKRYKTAGRMFQAYLPPPGLHTPHPHPWARSTNKPNPGPLMTASPHTQPALMPSRLAPPSTWSVAMGLLEGTESVPTSCTCAEPHGHKEDGSYPARWAVGLEDLENLALPSLNKRANKESNCDSNVW